MAINGTGRWILMNEESLVKTICVLNFINHYFIQSNLRILSMNMAGESYRFKT